MKKILIHVVVVGYFLAYCWATYKQNAFWGDILAPFGGLAAGVILYYVYHRSQRIRLIWLGLCMGCLVYGLTDLAWGVCDLGLGLDPNEMDVFESVYLFSNIFFALATLLFLNGITKNLNKTQLGLDITAISIASMITFWIIFMHGDIRSFVDIGNTLIYVTVVTDCLMIVNLTIWLMSIRGGRITEANYLAIAGVGLYASIDLYWAYIYFYDLYLKNSLIDSFYILSFILLAYGGVFWLRQNNDVWAENFYSGNGNIGPNKRGWFLLGFPILVMVFRDADYLNCMGLLSIYVFYQILSSFIQNAVKSKLLLQNEPLIERARQLEVTINQDALTNLPNRRLLLERLETVCNDYQRNGRGFAVVFLDIDGFKHINDTYGHDVGDQLLIEVSHRFLASIRKKDTMARFGGDEFVLIFTDLTDDLELQGVVHRLRKIFADPLKINNCICGVGVSIGVSKCPEDSLEAEELIKMADSRMYREKASRRPRSRTAQ